MEAEVINSKIFEIWNTYSAPCNLHLMPWIPWSMEKNCALFIGMNPSFDKAAQRDQTDYYKWNSGNKYYEFVHKEMTKNANRLWQKNRFYKRMLDIGIDCSTPVEHLDLFLLRETNQNKAKDLLGIYEVDNMIMFSDFALGQLNLALDIIDDLNPKAIVVANASASSILIQFLDSKGRGIIHLKEEGYHLFQRKDGNQIPIFFSSMFSGQRALDVYSFERLRWHIAKAVVG